MVAFLYCIITLFLYFFPTCICNSTHINVDDPAQWEQLMKNYEDRRDILNGTITIMWENVKIGFETDGVEGGLKVPVKNFKVTSYYEFFKYSHLIDSIEATCEGGDLTKTYVRRFFERCDCLVNIKFAEALVMNSFLLGLHCAISAEIAKNSTVQGMLSCPLLNVDYFDNCHLPSKAEAVKSLQYVFAKLDPFYTGGIIPGSACGITGLSSNSITINTIEANTFGGILPKFSFSIPAIKMICYFEINNQPRVFWDDLKKGLENTTANACKSVPPSDIESLKQFVKLQTKPHKISETRACQDHVLK